jgi:putative flippase GtrA
MDQQQETNHHIKHRKHIRHRLKSASKNAIQLKGVRYILSGGIATGVDVFTFFIMINYVLHKNNLEVGHIHIGAHIASLCVSFSLGLITNFLITKYFVFNESNIRGREQFVRYILVAAITFVGNYFMMKLLVDVFNVWPTLARLIAVGTIAVLSFRLHKVFTFKVKLPN